MAQGFNGILPSYSNGQNPVETLPFAFEQLEKLVVSKYSQVLRRLMTTFAHHDPFMFLPPHSIIEGFSLKPACLLRVVSEHRRTLVL